MGLHLTPTILESAYRFLQSTPPFNKWKLPHADHVSFRVLRTAHLGQCDSAGKHPDLAISTKRVSHTYTLLEVMAHEMVHLHLDRKGVRSEHGAEFRRCAALVCKYHGFDPKSF